MTHLQGLFRSARFRARPDEVVAALRKNSIGVALIYQELRRSPAAGLSRYEPDLLGALERGAAKPDVPLAVTLWRCPKSRRSGGRHGASSICPQRKSLGVPSCRANTARAPAVSEFRRRGRQIPCARETRTKPHRQRR